MSFEADDEILDIFGADTSVPGPTDDEILDEDEVLRIDETPETEDRQIEEAIDVHSEANPVAEPVLEEHKQLVSSEICEHRLVICEIDSQKTLQNECKPSTMNDKANLESVIKMDENPQVSLADDQQLEEEVLDYSEEFLADGPGKSDEISVDSNTQSLEAEEPSSSTLNVDSDDEDKERRDRFSTERKTAAFNKPSGEKKQLNLPDTLDDVVIQDDRHGGINNSNRNRMKINRWSKGPKSPPKAFSVRLVPSQQPRANFGQQLRPQFPQYQSEPTGYLDQQRVHINPHFRGSVSADPSIRLVWDHPVRPPLSFGPSQNYSNVGPFGVRLPPPQQFVQQRPPMPLFPPGMARFGPPVTAPPKASVWPPTVSQPPNVAFGAQPTFMNSSKLFGDKAVRWEEETLAFINKMGSKSKNDTTETKRHCESRGPASASVNVRSQRASSPPSRSRNHVTDRIGSKRRAEDEEVVVVKVKPSSVPSLDVDKDYLMEMEKMKNYREIILERKHRRRQESAGQTSSVSTAAANDSQINIATGQDFPEKTLKKVIPAVLLKDLPILTKTIINEQPNTFRTYRDSPSSSSQPPPKIIRLRDSVTGPNGGVVKTRVTAPGSVVVRTQPQQQQSHTSATEPKKNLSSMSSDAARSGRVAMIQPFRQKTAIGYPSNQPKPGVILSSMEAIGQGQKPKSLSERFAGFNKRGNQRKIV